MGNKNEQGGYHAKIMATAIFRNAVCVFLCFLSLIPFWIMIVNATRDSVAIQTSFSLIPSTHIMENFAKLVAQCNENVPLYQYMLNSCIIAGFSTVLVVYFSTFTAYGVVVYKFKGCNFAWAFIMAIMMIPVQVSSIGFFQFMYKLGLSNSYIPLIIPAIASPATVFFMRQYMLSALPLEIVDAARIDGSGEFRTFNTIAIPLMKPAIATQAIFAFIGSWNNFYTPSMIITSYQKMTLPMMIKKLSSDRLATDYGKIYCGIAISVVPLIIAYCCLSKYIVAGVALGGVKE